MTSAYYYLTKADYHNRLDKALRELGNEITIPKLSSAYGVTVFHISLTNAVVIYDGDKNVEIEANDRRRIRRTHSKLEQISGIKLTEFQKQLQNG